MCIRLTESQKFYLQTYKSLVDDPPIIQVRPVTSAVFGCSEKCRMSELKVRRMVFKVVTHSYFEALVMVLIAANVVVLAMNYEGNSELLYVVGPSGILVNALQTSVSTCCTRYAHLPRKYP